MQTSSAQSTAADDASPSPQLPLSRGDEKMLSAAQQATRKLNLSVMSSTIAHSVVEGGQRLWGARHALEGPNALRVCCFGSGVVLLLASIIQMIPFQSPHSYILHATQAFFGFVTMILEASNVSILQRLRPTLDEWAKFLTTAGGRGGFYLLVALLCFASPMWLDQLLGAIMMFVGCIAIAVHLGILARMHSDRGTQTPGGMISGGVQAQP